MSQFQALSAHCTHTGMLAVLAVDNQNTSFHAIASYLSEQQVIGVVPKLCGGPLSALLLPPGEFSDCHIATLAPELCGSQEEDGMTLMLVFIVDVDVPDEKPAEEESEPLSFQDLRTVLQQSCDGAASSCGSGLRAGPLLKVADRESSSKQVARKAPTTKTPATTARAPAAATTRAPATATTEAPATATT